MELVGFVTGRQRHRIEFGDVPSLDDVASAARIGPERFDDFGDLVDAAGAGIAAIARGCVDRPVDPLLAIDRAEIAPFRGKVRIVRDALGKILDRDVLAGSLHIFGVRPLVPDLHALLHQGADVGVPGEEPQHLARGGLPVDALGGDQRHRAIGKVEAQHRTEHGAGANARAIATFVAFAPDAAHEVEILLFVMLV